MSRKEVQNYIQEYRESNDKAVMRSHALYEYLKWKAIRDGIRAIEMKVD